MEPYSRKYYGRSERFAVDPEYAEQCRRNGCVEQWGKLAQWIAKPNHAGWEYKDYEVVYEAERLAAKGSGKGKPSTAPTIFQKKWNSKRQTRTAPSSAEAEGPYSWTANSSSGSYWNHSTWNR